MGGSRRLLDSLLLDPTDGPLDGAHRMGRFNCLALVAVVGPPLQEASQGLLEEIAHAPVLLRAP